MHPAAPHVHLIVTSAEQMGGWFFALGWFPHPTRESNLILEMESVCDLAKVNFLNIL
jgi:hypothetical protein